MSEVAFISYRRDDASAEAILVAKALREVLGEASVFLDTSSIEAGATWPDRIRSALAAARWVVVVVGPEWLRAGMNEWGQRRIDDASDWVRLELAAALVDEAKTVVPVLVQGAALPPATVLPKCVAGVSSRQAIELRRDHWDHDVERLTERLMPREGSGGGSLPGLGAISGIWDRLTPNLQDAFALAANAARREGKEIISTRTLFAALRRLHPDRLSEFFDKIPPKALPAPTPEVVPSRPAALAEIRLFSTCVQDSLNHFRAHTAPDEKVTTEAMFVDIAKHGTGKSVKQLRTYGVDVARITEIARQLGWVVAERA